MKIGLGTAQFGLDYGITNTEGKVSREEATRILKLASTAGIRMLDTAAAYGESEAVLGEIIPEPRTQFDLVTKTIPLGAQSVGRHEIAKLRAGFDQSLRRLKRKDVSTLLVHHADDLLLPGGGQIYDQLVKWREEGRVKRIGVSAYDAQQIEAVFNRFQFSVVQVPVSVFDQRLVENGMLTEFERMGVAVHARSIFMQGLLLQEHDQLPPQFEKWSTKVGHYRRYLEAHDVTPLQAAIGFVSRLPAVEFALVGVTSSNQLDQCIVACKAGLSLDLNQFSTDDIRLLDPRRWKTLA